VRARLRCLPSSWSWSWSWSLALALTASCAPGDEPSSASSGLIYGADDRIEYHQAPPGEVRTVMGEAIVALVPKANLVVERGKVHIAAPSWREQVGLCPGERFGEQPAAAFCSGVLLDSELVLTAGHCLRLFALERFVVVFGYHYGSPGMLAVDDVVDVGAILVEALDSPGTQSRMDFAWLRLARPPRAPHRPAALFAQTPPLTVGDPVSFIGAGGGIPLKLDPGGRARDLRLDSGDFFLADTDSTGGASGGALLDRDGHLLGILAKGGSDFTVTAAGCRSLNHQPDGARAEEEFTYAHHALAALCQADPGASTLCRSDCETPCRALAAPDGGCAMGGSSNRGLDVGAVSGLALLISCLRRSRRKQGV
jgi:hypothetical protein